MSNVWNNIEIARPPTTTIEYTVDECKSRCTDDCITALRSGLACIEGTLYKKSHIECLNLEVKILRHYLNYMRQLRVDKYYGLLRKILKCVHRWNELRLNDYAAIILKTMPASKEEFRSIRLPSRQMLEYMMMRIYGAFQLFLTIETSCREALPYILHKIYICYSYWTAMVFLAIIARLRVLSLNFALHLAKLYDDMHPWIQYLKDSRICCFTAEYSSSLLTILNKHCDSAKTFRRISKRKDSAEFACESSILNIFYGNETSLENINQILSEMTGKIFYGKLADERAMCSTPTEDKKVKKSKRKKLVGLEEEIPSIQKGNTCHTKEKSESINISKLQNPSLSSQAKEDLLSLLELCNGISKQNTDEVGNKRLEVSQSWTEFTSSDNDCRVLKSIFENTDYEDIGEVAEDQRKSVLKDAVKNKSKKRKRGDSGNHHISNNIRMEKKVFKNKKLKRTSTIQQHKHSKGKKNIM
ncbi:hypothetical protein SK128_024824 [Halocaridina rubra]|uniref:Nucleolus and neural progenitor protein-like N-terminal domain-containing protein n=1 Tax=Halocaridina rubra TaxID=373956 RepID=A0AAN8XL62_HALRR